MPKNFERLDETRVNLPTWNNLSERECSEGGTKSPSCNKLVQDIWNRCMQNQVWLTATHLPGALNVMADKQSQQLIDQTEWHLRADVLQEISKIWGTPNIDLFASRLNYQLTKCDLSWDNIH